MRYSRALDQCSIRGLPLMGLETAYKDGFNVRYDEMVTFVRRNVGDGVGNHSG